MGITGVRADYSYQKTGTMDRKGFYEDVSSAVTRGKEEVKEGTLTREEIFQMISKRAQEIYEKVKNNDTETSFQIGSQSFTIKEWNKLLEQFDAVQEDIREQMQEEQAKRHKETTTRITKRVSASVTSKDSTDIAKTAGVMVPDSRAEDVGKGIKDVSVMDSLVTESTICTYPASNEKEPEEMYITWYTREGIFCRKAGQTESYFWSISFETDSQYDKVIKFLNRLKTDVDYRFASHENFWQDFLKDEVDEDDFVDFLRGKKNRVQGDTYVGNYSSDMNEKNAKYAGYMDFFGENMEAVWVKEK